MKVNTLWAEPCLTCLLPNSLAPAQWSLAKFADWMDTGVNGQLGVHIDPVLHVFLSSVMASISALITFFLSYISGLLFIFFQNKILFTSKLNYLFQKCTENINPETVISFFCVWLLCLITWLCKVNYHLIAVFYSDIFLDGASESNTCQIFHFYLQNNFCSWRRQNKWEDVNVYYTTDREQHIINCYL